MRDRIIEIVRSGNTLKDLPSIVAKLSSFDESILFETLFPLCIQSQSKAEGVAFSAYAINQLNPKCNISVVDAINSLLPEWDISIEEVVFYLEKQFGKEAIRKTLDEIRPFSKDEVLTRLRTIDYWLQVNA